MASPDPRLVSRWLAALALVALAGGLALAVRQWTVPRVAPPAAPGPRAAARGDSIGRALAQTEAEDEKSRWRDEVPGVDLASFSPTRRELFLRLVNTRRCTCGCGYTLAACRAFDATCEKSPPRVVALFDSVAQGLIESADGLRPRPGRDETGSATR